MSLQQHVFSTVEVCNKKQGYNFFKDIQPIFLWMGMHIYIHLCLLYTRLYCDTYKPLSSGNNVYTDYIIISMLYCMSAVNCYEYIQLKNALHSFQ